MSGQDRFSVEQHNVASNAELRLMQVKFVPSGNGVVERKCSCHQRGGGDDSLLAALNNGAVDARSHTEVVCIDDEPAHGFSVASKKMGPRSRLH